MTFKLLTMPTSNPKLAKGLKRGVMSFALHLAPADLSGHEVCPRRSHGCTAACLNTAGRGRFDNVQAARIRRTQWYFLARDDFMAQLVREITHAISYANKRGYDAAFRLNATSDIPWHRVPPARHSNFANVMEMFPDAQFYDYTKVAKRLTSERLPKNYHLTFSANEDNADEMQDVLDSYKNVAVVYRTRAMVEELLARPPFLYPVIDGDETDLRYLDGNRGAMVLLYAKGKAKQDRSGFVRDL